MDKEVRAQLRVGLAVLFCVGALVGYFWGSIPVVIIFNILHIDTFDIVPMIIGALLCGGGLVGIALYFDKKRSRQTG